MWAPVTGYASQAFGANQLESIEDGILSGTDDRLFFRNTLDMITGKQKSGGNVVTTLNASAQKAAFDGLQKQGGKGAVAALDPSTGAILALASYPSYDPSTFAGNSTSTDSKAWTKLQKKYNPADPMLNRALRQTYPPGSTFKVVTAAAALENNLYDDPRPEDQVPAALDDARHQHTAEERGPHRLRERHPALSGAAVSCNNVFLDAALKVGDKGMGRRPRSSASTRTSTRRRSATCSPPRASTQSSTSPAPPSPAWVRAASRAPRCRWRWSPQPSPTTAS